MFKLRKILFPLQYVSAREALGMIVAALVHLVTGGGSTRQRSRFERSFNEFAGGGESVGFPSGRSALAALLLVNEVKPGDEVLVTGLTCEAVIEAILAVGATPRWIDVETSTMSMNPNLAELAITPSTRAIIVQHSFGIPLPLEPFRNLAAQHDLAIIEDCCLALGSMHPDGTLIGNSEFDAFWSFEMTKTISSGWGGLALVKNADRAAKAKSIREESGSRTRINSAKALNQAGITALCYRPRFTGILAYIPVLMERIGIFNTSKSQIGGMTTQTAFGNFGSAGPDATWGYLTNQLERLPDQLKKIRRNNKAYFEAMESVGITLPSSWLAETNIFLRIPILVQHRAKFEVHMRSAGIDTGRWFDNPVSPNNTQHTAEYTRGLCPVGENLSKAITNLPTHASMQDGDLQTAVNTLTQYFNANEGEADHMNRLLSDKIEALQRTGD
jgi:perosamine synthetase